MNSPLRRVTAGLRHNKGTTVTKPGDRRAAILDLLADHVLVEGLSASSLRPLAKAAGISDRMLLYYFRDKAEVIGAVLDIVAMRLVTVLNAQGASAPLPLDAAIQKIGMLVLADELWPFMRLWLELASLSARGDPLYRTVGERIARGFLAWGASHLDSPTPHARDADAAKLLATVEGMVLLKSVGLDDVCRKLV